MRQPKALRAGLTALALVLAAGCAEDVPPVGETVEAPVVAVDTTGIDSPLAARAERVEIIRDDFGVPHIYAKTDADAVFGMLYAQAEDCLLYTSPSPRDQRGSRMPSSA